MGQIWEFAVDANHSMALQQDLTLLAELEDGLQNGRLRADETDDLQTWLRPH